MSGGRRIKNKRGLTGQQQLFADLYLADPEHNAKRAYMAAYPGCKESTAETNGPELLRNTQVGAYIANEEEKVRQRLLEKYGATEERIERELCLIAFARISDYMDWGPNGVYVKDSEMLYDFQKAGVLHITQTREGITIRLDKLRALELLGRRRGMWKDRVEAFFRSYQADTARNL